MSKKLVPLFVFSTPRSGSTLLQRILTSHDEISSASETWLLLPMLYTMKKYGMASEYGYVNTVNAIKDFYQILPNGKEDYLDVIREMTLTLYGKLSEDSKYFLDKTPRYTLISNEIFQLFPEGKYIVLWRNPLSVIASVLTTWKSGKWGISHIKVDIFDGVQNLVDLCEHHADSICIVKYEDIVINSSSTLKRIFEYLNLEWNDDVLSEFDKVSFKGAMGDPTGIMNYKKISDKSCDKWKAVMCNPLRKWWCRKYLRWLGSERLKIMGYDMDVLLNDLKSTPSGTKYLLSDSVRMLYGYLDAIFDVSLLRLKIKTLREGKSQRVFH